MNPIISPGDRVAVEIRVNGYYRRTAKGTVVRWTKAGRISVKLDNNEGVKNVSPELVKKVADKSINQ